MIATIISIIVIVIMIIITTIIGVKLSKATRKIEADPNMPICINLYRRQFTEGYCIGLEKRDLPRKNGCEFIEYYPLDPIQGEHKPLPKLQSMVVGKGMRIVFARGELSSYREIVIYTSPMSLDIPEKLRNMAEGKMLTKEALKQHFTNTLGLNSIKAGFEALGEEMSTYAFNQIPTAILKQYEELVKKLSKITTAEPELKDKEKK